MRKFILMIAGVLVTLMANAQTDFEMGVKGGLNMANITDLDGDKKASFHVGTFQKFRFNEHLGVQVDLLYSRQGFKHKTAKEWLRVNYLNIPVLINVYLFERFTADFGPQVGVVLSGSTKVKSGDVITIAKNKNLNDIELGLGMGLSYEFNGGILLAVRYNVGLSNVVKKKVADNHANKNEVFQLSLGYRFDF